MTVKELKLILNGIPDDAELWLSSDDEGNRIRNLDELSLQSEVDDNDDEVTAWIMFPGYTRHPTFR